MHAVKRIKEVNASIDRRRLVARTSLRTAVVPRAERFLVQCYRWHWHCFHVKRTGSTNGIKRHTLWAKDC